MDEWDRISGRDSRLMSELDHYRDLILDICSPESPDELFRFRQAALKDPELVPQLDELATDAPPTHILNFYRYARYNHFDLNRLMYVFQSTDQAYEELKDYECFPSYLKEQQYEDFWAVWQEHLCQPLGKYLEMVEPFARKRLQMRLSDYFDRKHVREPLFQATLRNCKPETILRVETVRATENFIEKIRHQATNFAAGRYSEVARFLEAPPPGLDWSHVRDVLREYPVLEVMVSVVGTIGAFTGKIEDVYRDRPERLYFRRHTLILQDVLSAMLRTGSLCERLAEKNMTVRYDYHLRFSINGADWMRNFVIVEGRHPAFEPCYPDLTVQAFGQAEKCAHATRGFSQTEIVELIEYIETEIARFGGQ